MIKHFLCFLLIFFPVLSRAGNAESFTSFKDQSDLYVTLNLAEKGLSFEVMQLALKGYFKLKSNAKLRNSGILTIIDFSQSSKNKRLYVINLVNKTLVVNTYVAHGLNTGGEFAEHFSNVPGSHESSLGFYITREEGMGACFGLSLALIGMEKGFNDNALKRGIIMHGADFAAESVIARFGKLGRSFGCPTLPPDQIKPVVDIIKDGTCLFIYQKNEQYLYHSILLN
jgi:hypothetical protein